MRPALSADWPTSCIGWTKTSKCLEGLLSMFIRRRFRGYLLSFHETLIGVSHTSILKWVGEPERDRRMFLAQNCEDMKWGFRLLWAFPVFFRGEPWKPFRGGSSETEWITSACLWRMLSKMALGFGSLSLEFEGQWGWMRRRRGEIMGGHRCPWMMCVAACICASLR